MKATMTRGHGSVGALGAVALAMLLPACGGGAVMSGAAAGRIGSGLSAEAQRTPRGGEVCALHEAVTALPGSPDKPVAEVCEKAWKSDELWRRAMIVLSAHAERLGELAQGEKPEQAGRLSAALTGVTGPDFADADGPQETAAKDAVVKLVQQLTSSKNDLAKSVKEAAPQVKTLCDGLEAYLTDQLGKLDETRSEIDKKRTAGADRRCAVLDNRPLCVSQSMLDRVTYAGLFSDLAELQTSHMEARDSLREFCMAHRKLEEAADKGTMSKEQTWADIVNSVQSMPRGRANQGAPAASSPEPSPAPKK